MRPDRPIVIGHRIVAGFAAGKGAHSPSRKRISRKKCFGGAGRVLGARDFREQAMTGIGRSHPAGPLLAVQRQGVRTLLITPEGLLEPQLQGLGFVRQLPSQL